MNNKYCLPVKSAKGKDLVYCNTHIPASMMGAIPILLVFSLFGGLRSLTAIGTFLVQNFLIIASQQGYATDILGINLSNNLTYENNNTKDNNFYIYKSPVLAIDDGEVVDTRNRVNGPTMLENSVSIYSVLINIKLIYIPWNAIFAALGNYIIIKHKNGIYSLYAHLCKDTLNVKVGDKVKRGQTIALVGNTGNSSEPHLHFEICKFNPKFIEYILPISGVAMSITNLPVIIPTTISSKLNGFEPHKYKPIVNHSSSVFYGSLEYIIKAFKTNNIGDLFGPIKDSNWKLNNSGEIHQFCVIKGK